MKTSVSTFIFAAFCLVTVCLVLLVTVGNATFDRSDVVKSLIGLDLTLVGAMVRDFAKTG